jgi:alpha-tubulin suppressor-like RCC1 family protein
VISLYRMLGVAGLLLIAALDKGLSQSIATSANHTCAISVAGEMYCWGSNVWKPSSRIRHDSTPMPMVDSARRFSSVGTGLLHDCAVSVDGQVWCAGVTTSGEMGRDPHRACQYCGRPDTIASPLRFRSVVTGESHSCALSLDRRAWCWGSNEAGQVGTGDRVERIDWPTAVVGGHRWLSLVAGDRHTCGITTEERVLCWGANNYGQLGFDQRRRRGCNLPDRCMAVPYPIDDTTRFASLAAGYGKTCGVSHAGQMYCWGREYSRLRDTVPIAMHIATPFAIQSMALGYGSSCALAIGGDAYCWLENNLGTVGSAGIGRRRDGSPFLTNQPVNTNVKFVQLAAGGSHVCGIAVEGGVYCWGRLNLVGPDLSCREAGACSAVPVRVAGDLNLLKPASAKR